MAAAKKEEADVFDDTASPKLTKRGSNSAAALRGYIERIEKLMEERATINQDIKEIGLEATAAGLDMSVIRRVIALRKLEQDKVDALKLYADAMGVFG